MAGQASNKFQVYNPDPCMPNAILKYVQRSNRDFTAIEAATVIEPSRAAGLQEFELDVDHVYIVSLTPFAVTA